MKSHESRLMAERFACIETELFWGDGVTAGSLAGTFGISRQAAQNIIDLYRQNYPGQMQYHPSRKRHEATAEFEPAFIRSNVHAFLDYLRGQALVGFYHEAQDWSDLHVTDVDRLLRPNLQLDIVRTVLAAHRRRQTVMIDYRSKGRDPESPSTSVISPNHLIFADDRYHIRAYCHKKDRHLDFVLSRVACAEPADAEWVSSENDAEWNEFVEVRLHPNPDLSSSAREALLKGFETKESGVRSITCRKALLFYIRRRLLADDPVYGMPLWKVLEA